MSPKDITFIAALLLVALCATLVGFPFLPALGVTLVLALVFYLIQVNTQRKRNSGSET
ncbi:hypothetical protein KKA00_10950 [bacterium]|nr:hypothetical protein [bacterium]MBU1652730.1 hypothetical protein [bacterium]